MKNTKKCPKCDSTEIYSNAGQTKYGDRSVIPVGSWKSIYVDVYACMNCGYFEEYLDGKDKAGREKLMSTWKKV